MRIVGFAIVGAGAISEVHAKAIGAIEGAELIGVFDVVSTASERFAGVHHCAVYSDYDALLSDERVDAVCVCTPSGLRETFVVRAAQAKKHVVCEKPIEIALDRIDRMIEACDQHGVMLCGIFNNRYNPVYARLKHAVDSGALGRLLLGDVYVKWYRSQEYYAQSSWRGTWQYDGGGALMNQSIHFIDLLQWIMGPVKEVKAFAGALAHDIEVEDTACAAIRFENGALGMIEGSTACAPGLGERMEVHGERGSVKIDSGRIVYWNVDGKDMPQEELDEINPITKGGSSNPLDVDVRLHQLELTEIVRCIQDGTLPPIDGREARKAIALILSIYQSAGIGT